MKPVTLLLPISQQPVSHPRPSWFETVPQAAFWFPDAESKSVCMKALGLTDRPLQLLVKSGDYQLLLHTFVGQTRRDEMLGTMPHIFYLSPRMFSSDPYFNDPQRFSKDCYSLCLLDKIQLEKNDGEVPILIDLHD